MPATIHWSEPEDLHLDQLDELLVRPWRTNEIDWHDGFFTRCYYGRSFVSVPYEYGRFDRDDPELFRRLARLETAASAWSQYHQSSAARLDNTEVRYDNILALVAFLSIALLPAYCRSPRATANASQPKRNQSAPYRDFEVDEMPVGRRPRRVDRAISLLDLLDIDGENHLVDSDDDFVRR